MNTFHRYFWSPGNATLLLLSSPTPLVVSSNDRWKLPTPQWYQCHPWTEPWCRWESRFKLLLYLPKPGKVDKRHLRSHNPRCHIRAWSKKRNLEVVSPTKLIQVILCTLCDLKFKFLLSQRHPYSNITNTAQKRWTSQLNYHLKYSCNSIQWCWRKPKNFFSTTTKWGNNSNEELRLKNEMISAEKSKYLHYNRLNISNYHKKFKWSLSFTILSGQIYIIIKYF